MKKILALCFGLVIFITSHAQRIRTTINNTEFVTECMKGGGELPHKQIVLWVPYNLWQIIGDQMKISPDYTRRLVNEMKNYTVFCVVDYSMGNPSMTFVNEQTIRNTIVMKDSSGKVFKPIEQKDLTPLTAQVIEQIQPTLSQMFGQFGSGMRMFIFKSDLVNGEPAITITKKNNFSLNWGDRSFKWKLPLASALEPRHCPVDGEEMKGNWNYCPEHGNLLED